MHTYIYIIYIRPLGRQRPGQAVAPRHGGLAPAVK